MKLGPFAAMTIVPGIVAVSLASQASQFNGRWTGSGQALSGTCSDIEISVTVDGDSVNGEAMTIDRSFEIEANLSGEGKLRGQVSKIGFAVAEITGAVRNSKGSGEWRTLRGEDCRGTFTMEKQAG